MQPWCLVVVCICVYPVVVVVVVVGNSCNRYSAQQKAKKEVDKARNDMEKHYMEKAVQDLAEHQRKLDHYHSRYSNHLRSIKVHTSRIAFKLLSTGTPLGLGMPRSQNYVSSRKDLRIHF